MALKFAYELKYLLRTDYKSPILQCNTLNDIKQKMIILTKQSLTLSNLAQRSGSGKEVSVVVPMQGNDQH